MASDCLSEYLAGHTSRPVKFMNGLKVFQRTFHVTWPLILESKQGPHEQALSCHENLSYTEIELYERTWLDSSFVERLSGNVKDLGEIFDIENVTLA